MKNSGLVSIILLNCNGKKWNKNCIDSILKQTYKNYEIIFVNNMSTDGSLEEVQNLYKSEIKKGIIRIVVNPLGNTGFTGGNNLGVKNSNKNSEFICLLNNDTTVPKNWLRNLTNSIKFNDNLGAVGSIILNKGHEKEEKELIFDEKKSIWMNMYGLFGYKNISDIEFKNKLFYTNFISGCCFLYRKDLFNIPFEDYYFIYNEDTFLSRRIINKGYKLGLSLDSFVNHFGGGTAISKSILKKNLYLNNRNKIINILSFYPISYLFIFLPLFIFEEFFSIFSGSIFSRVQIEYLSFQRIINNRKDIQKTKRKINDERNILFSDFLMTFSHNLFDIKDLVLKHSKFIILCVPFLYLINLIYIIYYSVCKAILGFFNK